MDKLGISTTGASQEYGSSQHGTSTDAATPGSSKPKPDDLYEILCNDVLLPLDMTLAAVRQFVWRQAAELILHYRKRIATPTGRG